MACQGIDAAIRARALASCRLDERVDVMSIAAPSMKRVGKSLRHHFIVLSRVASDRRLRRERAGGCQLLCRRHNDALRRDVRGIPARSAAVSGPGSSLQKFSDNLRRAMIELGALGLGRLGRARMFGHTVGIVVRARRYVMPAARACSASGCRNASSVLGMDRREIRSAITFLAAAVVRQSVLGTLKTDCSDGSRQRRGEAGLQCPLFLTVVIVRRYQAGRVERLR